MPHPLDTFFAPQSIALIGASRDPSSLGRRILTALTANGFTGEVFPVNPHASELDGRRCYPTVPDLPMGVDLAVLALPYPLVPQAVDQCAAVGVKSLAVITAGFAPGPSGQVELPVQFGSILARSCCVNVSMLPAGHAGSPVQS